MSAEPDKKNPDIENKDLDSESNETAKTESEKHSEKETETVAESSKSEAVYESDDDAVEASAEKHIEELEADIKKAQEDYLRAIAEKQNAERRASLDVEKARKFALESFVKELLPVVDNLERALTSAGTVQEESSAFVEGVELTLKSFQAALEKNRVNAIDPAGEPFNPEQHQAMASVENTEVEANTVIEVFQKGYELNGRLIRPAMVVVSKTGG